MVIYKTTNLLNGKIYIGKTKCDRKGYIGSGNLIKEAIKKYGKENFIKEIIDAADTFEELNEKEIYWIDFYNSTDKSIGYNIHRGGNGDTFENRLNVDEVKQKLSVRGKERIGIKNPFYGKRHTAETKALISEKNKQHAKIRKQTLTDEERKIKYSRAGSKNGMFGRCHSKTSIKLMKQNSKGKSAGEKNGRFKPAMEEEKALIKELRYNQKLSWKQINDRYTISFHRFKRIIKEIENECSE